jgi:hypothetical protein
MHLTRPQEGLGLACRDLKRFRTAKLGDKVRPVFVDQ